MKICLKNDLSQIYAKKNQVPTYPPMETLPILDKSK